MDPKQRDMILQELQAGSSFTVACGIAGVHPGTASNWLQKGKQDVDCETIYGEFYIDVQRARALHERVVTRQVAKYDNWRAKAFILENLYPETWSPKQRVELTGASGGPITTRDLDNLTDDQLLALMGGATLSDVLSSPVGATPSTAIAPGAASGQSSSGGDA